VDAQGAVWLARQTSGGIQVVSEDGQTSIFEQTGTFNALALAPDGSRLALWRTGGPVEIYALPSGERLQTLTLTSEFLPQYTPSLAFSPNGETLTVAVCLQEMESEDGNRLCQLPDLQFWEISTATEIRSMKNLFKPSAAPDLGVQAYFPDGGAIGAGNADGSINLFTLGFSSEPALLLQGHRRSVSSLAFSPDGTLMASGGRDGSLVLWDRASYQALGSPFNPGRLGITALAFAADSRTLLAAYEDGSLMAWNVDAEAWVNIACEVAGNGLDEDQQARYFPKGGYRDICAARQQP
jgi:WD40 repeat protein